MNRRAVSMLLLLATTTSVMAADRLWLKDGRNLRGRILLKRDQVILLDGRQAHRFPGHAVQRIDSQKPAEDLVDRQARPDPKNGTASEWFDLARWLEALQLNAQARQAYRKTLRQDPSHVQAHQAIGDVRIDEQWLPLQTALAQARQHLDIGQAREVIDFYLPAIQPCIRNSQERLALGKLAVLAYLQCLDFHAAQEQCLQLARDVPDPDHTRYAVLADILANHPDGVVILDAPWPPASSLLNEAPAVLPGPASLSQPETLQAVWHAHARDTVARADAILGEAAEDLTTAAAEPDKAQNALDQARALIDEANALSPGITQPYRNELQRLTLLTHRLRVDLAARDFDQRLSALWDTPKEPAAYRRAIDNLLAEIDHVEIQLHSISEIVRQNPHTYPSEQLRVRNDLLLLRQLRKVLLLERQEADRQRREVANAS